MVSEMTTTKTVTISVLIAEARKSRVIQAP